jgi:hypothetical protein
MTKLLSLDLVHYLLYRKIPCVCRIFQFSTKSALIIKVWLTFHKQKSNGVLAYFGARFHLKTWIKFGSLLLLIKTYDETCHCIGKINNLL